MQPAIQEQLWRAAQQKIALIENSIIELGLGKYKADSRDDDQFGLTSRRQRILWPFELSAHPEG